jgi:hypothetical protein
MANKPATTATAVWNTALAQREEIIHNLNQNPGQNRQLEDRLVAVEEQILELAAPDLAAVALKLKLLWEAQLEGLDDESRQKRLVLSDIQRLAR